MAFSRHRTDSISNSSTHASRGKRRRRNVAKYVNGKGGTRIQDIKQRDNTIRTRSMSHNTVNETSDTFVKALDVDVYREYIYSAWNRIMDLPHMSDFRRITRHTSFAVKTRDLGSDRTSITGYSVKYISTAKINAASAYKYKRDNYKVYEHEKGHYVTTKRRINRTNYPFHIYMPYYVQKVSHIIPMIFGYMNTSPLRRRFHRFVRKYILRRK
jgi:hypothetical protein